MNIKAVLKKTPSQTGRSNGISLQDYCERYNANLNAKEKINISLLSRLINGKNPQKITPKVEAICRHLEIDIYINPNVSDEFTAIIEKIPESKHKEVKSILQGLVILAGEKI